uniref:Ion_trans domain-containing protein n=1 Tax=Parastrongyloides trichosuri TaxID=131310 RepID=A0A0N5A735_PARTI
MTSNQGNHLHQYINLDKKQRTNNQYNSSPYLASRRRNRRKTTVVTQNETSNIDILIYNELRRSLKLDSFYKQLQEKTMRAVAEKENIESFVHEMSKIDFNDPSNKILRASILPFRVKNVEVISIKEERKDDDTLSKDNIIDSNEKEIVLYVVLSNTLEPKKKRRMSSTSDITASEDSEKIYSFHSSVSGENAMLTPRKRLCSPTKLQFDDEGLISSSETSGFSRSIDILSNINKHNSQSKLNVDHSIKSFETDIDNDNKFYDFDSLEDFESEGNAPTFVNESGNYYTLLNKNSKERKDIFSKSVYLSRSTFSGNILSQSINQSSFKKLYSFNKSFAPVGCDSKKEFGYLYNKMNAKREYNNRAKERREAIGWYNVKRRSPTNISPLPSGTWNRDKDKHKIEFTLNHTVQQCAMLTCLTNAKIEEFNIGIFLEDILLENFYLDIRGNIILFWTYYRKTIVEFIEYFHTNNMNIKLPFIVSLILLITIYLSIIFKEEPVSFKLSYFVDEEGNFSVESETKKI